VKWLGRHRISGRVFTLESEIPLLPLSFCLLGSTGIIIKNHSLGFSLFSFFERKKEKLKKTGFFSLLVIKGFYCLKRIPLTGFLSYNKLRERGFSGSWAREVWAEGN
jgi:hypothetical protein